MEIPVCAVTGLIAGDSDACGDCDPCFAAHAAPDVVKRLIAEKEEWRQKYADAATERDMLREIEAAAKCVFETFRKDEAEGYRSRDRQFAIEVLGKAMETGCTRGPNDPPCGNAGHGIKDVESVQ